MTACKLEPTNFTSAKLERRMRDIEASIGRYLVQMDTADRQEPTIAKAKRLQDKIAAVKEQMQILKQIEVQLNAAPDKQVLLTDPGDTRVSPSRHYRVRSEDGDVERDGSRSLQQRRFHLQRRGERVSLPSGRASHMALHDNRARAKVAPLLELELPAVFVKGQVHAGHTTPGDTLGTRRGSR
jgi:hypothetical protein